MGLKNKATCIFRRSFTPYMVLYYTLVFLTVQIMLYKYF